MALTAAGVKAAVARPHDKPSKLADGAGMYLLITPSGAAGWRLKYRIAGKEKLISLGAYPEVTLAEARERREEARKLIKQGVDPSASRKATKRAQRVAADNTFARLAEEWAAQWRPGRAAGTVAGVERRLKLLAAEIGSKPVAEIEPDDLLAALMKIQDARGPEVAHRALSLAGAVFDRAVVRRVIKLSPAYGVRKLLARAGHGHRQAQTEEAGLALVLQKIDTCDNPVVRAALQLLPMLLCRPGELRAMRWDDLHGLGGDKPEWRFIAPKTGTDRIVPLPRQAVAIIEGLRDLTGGRTFVLAGGSNGMISSAVLSATMKYRLSLDGVQVPHGFRATARTMLDEKLGFRVDWVEAQLGHAVRDPLGRAYNRTQFLEERRGMLQAWADYLDRLRRGETDSGNVVPLRRPS